MLVLLSFRLGVEIENNTIQVQNRDQHVKI